MAKTEATYWNVLNPLNGCDWQPLPDRNCMPDVLKTYHIAMKKLRNLMLTLAFFPGLVAADERKNVNAGVTPYACTDSGAQYLLAFDPHPRRLAWGAFGGGPKKGETASETALRELREETNCVFSEGFLSQLDLKGPSKSGSYYNFVAEVPYVSTDQIKERRECLDVERFNWQWVSHAALIKGLQSDVADPQVEVLSRPGQKVRIWGGAAKSLRSSLRDGNLPLSDPCP